MDINEILREASQLNASDIHLKVGNNPIIRVNGALTPLEKYPKISPEMMAEMGFAIMSKQQKEYFLKTHDLDMAYGVPGVGRFRVNVFQQRGSMGMVLRIIPSKVKTLRELMLPPVLEKIAAEERGLILVTGTTGSGKSTTLASIIDHINSTRPSNIMTIEDPIEFLIRDKRSLINQRELGVDTISFAKAIKSALRQDPDVILVGEMRDFETIETALTAAETGHLVLSTLHTIDAPETINRIISVFPPHQQKQVRIQLSSIVKAIISQRLIPTKTGGRVAAVEVMVSTSRIREMISDPERTKEIHDAIAEGGNTYGMQTFDQSLMNLINKGIISYQDALRFSSNPDDFALKFSGISGTSDRGWGNPTNQQSSSFSDDVEILDDLDVLEPVEIPKEEKKEEKKTKFSFSSMDDLF
ncbi:type IV pilus twitching motility protein PilT [bacterium]|nr:type IV pilus twitching motility protein PilT [bacterium]